MHGAYVEHSLASHGLPGVSSVAASAAVQHSMSITEFQRLQTAYARGQGHYMQQQYPHPVSYQQQMPMRSAFAAPMQPQHSAQGHRGMMMLGGTVGHGSQHPAHAPSAAGGGMQMPQGHGTSQAPPLQSSLPPLPLGPASRTPMVPPAARRKRRSCNGTCTTKPKLSRR